MKPIKHHLLTAMAAGAAFAVTSASAVTDTWITAGGNGNWDLTSNNWNDGTTAGVRFMDGNDVVFNNTAGGTITVVAAVSPASTLFNVTGNNYTLTGSIVSGAGPLTKSGSSQLSLRGVNSFTGKTTVNAGTLDLTGAAVAFTKAGVNGPLGAPVGANATIDLHNGTTLQTLGTNPRINQETDRPLNLAGTGPGTVSLRVNDNDTRFTFGNVTASGTGAKNLALFMGSLGNGDRESVVFTGGISDSSDATPTSLSVSFNTGNSAHLSLVGTSTFTGSISTVNANVNLNSVSTLTVGGLYTGPNPANDLPTENVRGTGSLGSGNYAGNISLAAKTVLNYRSTTNQTLGGVISGAGAVTVDGLSTVTMTGLNTYSGDTTVNTGSTLVLAGQVDTIPAGGVTFAVNNTSNNKITGAGTAMLDGTFTINTAAVTNAVGSWTLVNVANKSFGTSFSVAGFTESDNVWTLVSGPKTWTFTEGTGVLTLTSTALFTSFGIPGYPGVIDNTALTIQLVVPKNAELATLAPTYTLASGTCNQTSGLPPSPTFGEANPVTYTIMDGTTVRDYAVTIILATDIINFRVSNGTSIPEADLEGPAGPPVPGTQKWNQVTALPALSASGLLDSVGAPTMVGFSASVLEGADDWGMNAPLKLLSRTGRVFSTDLGNSGSFTISGLTPDTYYDLWIASSHINGSGIGTWSTTNTNSTGASVRIDNTGASANGSTWVAGVNYVRFQSVKVNVSGNITMTVKNDVLLDNRVGFNGFQLIPVAAPTATDYDNWLVDYPTITAPADKLPTADPDGDGLTNQQEYAFGLSPANGSSVDPITAPLNKTVGTFTYTRRATPAATGLKYTVLTSSDLDAWSPDVAATSSQNVIGTLNGVETVEVTLTGDKPLAATKLFVRVEAAP